MYYQKDRIRSYDMNFFDKEIKKQIQFLRNVLNKKNSLEIPLYLKIKLINIIEKSKRNWKPYFFETVNQINIDLIPNIPINIKNYEIQNYENDNSNNKKYSKKKKNNYSNSYSNPKNYSDSYDNLYNRQFFEDYDYYNYERNDNYYDNYQNNYSGFSYNYKKNKNKSSSNLQNKNYKNKNQNFQKWK
jgi:hypothetical protein